MYEITWFRCCKKCERMKRKYLKQKEINEKLLLLIEKLNKTQMELAEIVDEKKS